MPAMLSEALQQLAVVGAGPLGADAFEQGSRLPWLLLLAALPFLVSWRPGPGASERRFARALRWRAGDPALAWPAHREVAAAGGRRREWLPRLARALRWLALCALAVALAGPTATRLLPPEPGLGIDLILVLDASGSMNALDARVASPDPDAGIARAPDGARGTRFELARQVVRRFARTRIQRGDRVGLVAFGDDAVTACPLTVDGRLLEAAVDGLRVGMLGDGTALGDALALAVKRVRVVADEAAPVVVLLTDGRSNGGGVPVDVARALAAGEGIRVHTVGIGSLDRRVEVREGGPSGRTRVERHAPDFEALESIARETGGRAWRARTSGELARVYAEIDATERALRPLPARRVLEASPEPALVMAGALLLCEIGCSRLVRRRIP